MRIVVTPAVVGPPVPDQVDDAELTELGLDILEESPPRGTPRERRAAFGLEAVPLQGLLGGDHELRVDSRTCPLGGVPRRAPQAEPCRAIPNVTAAERAAEQRFLRLHATIGIAQT